jgi:hypothetical protein
MKRSAVRLLWVLGLGAFLCLGSGCGGGSCLDTYYSGGEPYAVWCYDDVTEDECSGLTDAAHYPSQTCSELGFTVECSKENEFYVWARPGDHCT